MKLRVQRADGSIETISIAGPVEIDEGRAMAHIHSAEGLDHYFTFEGHYDGWGMACAIPMEENAEPMSGEVKELIERVESDRDIESPKP